MTRHRAGADGSAGRGDDVAIVTIRGFAPAQYDNNADRSRATKTRQVDELATRPRWSLA
jgi:hypothetical protein